MKLNPPVLPKSEPCYRLATIFAKAYLLDQAISHYKVALLIKDEKRIIDILLKLAICHIEKEEYDNALQICEIAFTKNSHNAMTLRHLAWCEFLVGKYKVALEHIDEAVMMEGTEAKGYYVRGRILLALEKLTEASEEFKNATRLDKTNAVYITSLAITYSVKELYKNAHETYLDAAKLNQNAPEIWYNFGVTYEMTQQHSEALLAYEEALKRDKDYYLAIVNKQRLNNGHAIDCPCFVHLPFFISDSMLFDKKLGERIKRLCADYFEKLNDSYNQPMNEFIVSAKPETVNSSDVIKNKTLIPGLTQLHSHERPPSKSNMRENLKAAERIEPQSYLDIQLPVQSNNNLKSSAPIKSQENPPCSFQPQARLLPSIPAAKTPSMDYLQANALEFWRQLLQSQQNQAQSILAHDLALKPNILTSTTIPMQSNVFATEPSAIRCQLAANSNKDHVSGFYPVSSILQQPNVAAHEDVPRLNGKLSEAISVKAPCELQEAEDLKYRTRSSMKKATTDNESTPQKRTTRIGREREMEEIRIITDKQSNKIIIPDISRIHEKNKANSDTVVRINIATLKPNLRKRKQPEYTPSTKIYKEDRTIQYKKSKH